MSGREIARQIGASKSGVNEFLKLFEACEAIGYPLPSGITNYGIAELVYGNPPGNNGRNPNIEYPDYGEVHRQLTGRKSMTLVFLWNRYKKRCDAAGSRYYQYRQFCEHYAEWCEENAETLHFNAVIAEKMEVDFAGKTFEVTDPLTGEILTVVVFVAVLPYTERRVAKVSSDFHVRFDNAYYSVPKAYVHKEISIKATATSVRIYSKQGEFLYEWPRADHKGKWSTDPDHLPANCQGYGQWNAAYFISRARLVGASTEAVIHCQSHRPTTSPAVCGIPGNQCSFQPEDDPDTFHQGFFHQEDRRSQI